MTRESILHASMKDLRPSTVSGVSQEESVATLCRLASMDPIFHIHPGIVACLGAMIVFAAES